MLFFLLKAEQMMCESMEVRGQPEARKKIIREELQFFFNMKSDAADGCDGLCGMLHPLLCRSSTLYGNCTQVDCTLTHLLGTQRPMNHADRTNNGYEPRVSHNKWRSKFNNHQNNRHFSMSNPNTFPVNYSNRNFRNYNKSKDFVYDNNDFPPLQGLPRSNIDDLTTAMKQMQSSMQQFVQCSLGKNPEQRLNNNEQRTLLYPNGYHENNPTVPNRHVDFQNQQEQYHDAKNYEMANQRFAQ